MVIDKDRNENILTFWDSYYKRKISTFPNSAFSTYCLNYLNKESTLIDVGCGDGRDSLFFSRNHIYTTGIDFSSEVINQNKKFENDYLNFLNIDLNLIDKYIVKNGVIVFDQALKKEWGGEKKAMQEFYRLYKSKYKIIKLNKNFSPDVI